MSYKVLIVPSNRESNFNQFLEAWKGLGDWDDIFLIEDNPTKTIKSDVFEPFHFSWNEIEEQLGADSWIISKRDSAIRSFGFYKAHQAGADYVLTLDDDCYPYSSDICEDGIFESHIKQIENAPKWIESIPGMRTRGLPYFNKGKMNNVVGNMGLWSKIPDYDSIQSLNHPPNGNFVPSRGSRLIPSGQYFPLCGMNFCFRGDVIPLSYFPLMGEGQPFRRFDDIWFGIIFKKIIDHLGMSVSVGEPFVQHQRASDVMTNLVKEAPGIAANEHFWERIDSIELTTKSPADCMLEIGRALDVDSDTYVSKLGTAIQIWAALF